MQTSSRSSVCIHELRGVGGKRVGLPSTLAVAPAAQGLESLWIRSPWGSLARAARLLSPNLQPLLERIGASDRRNALEL